MKFTRATILLAALVPAAVSASAWDIDSDHSHSSFTVKHLVISTVRGEFGKTTGKVSLDEADITRSQVEAVIDVTTIDTRVVARDSHLKSADFFDTANHPTMIFKSTKVERAGEGKLKVTGNLTIRGTTHPVVLDVDGPTSAIKGPKGEQRRALIATTQLNRMDFGLKWNKVVEAGPVVGDKVNVEISLELVKVGDGK